MHLLLLLIGLLLPLSALAQRTSASRFLARMLFDYRAGTDPLTPSDSVGTAVQTISISWHQRPGGWCQIYLYRPALSSHFYLKRLWMQTDSSNGSPVDTTFGESRLMQVLPRLSARLERFMCREGNYRLPPYSVHYSPTPSPAPAPPRRAARHVARQQPLGFEVRLEQAPPYSLAYRTKLDPQGYPSREILRSLKHDHDSWRNYGPQHLRWLTHSPWHYYRHQRRAYRQLLRLVRDFTPTAASLAAP